MTDSGAAFTVRNGVVSTFDEHVGAGVIDEPGHLPWSFHCTSIADGSRTIEIGTPVRFTVRPGPLGLEAFGVASAS